MTPALFEAKVRNVAKTQILKILAFGFLASFTLGSYVMWGLAVPDTTKTIMIFVFGMSELFTFSVVAYALKRSTTNFQLFENEIVLTSDNKLIVWVVPLNQITKCEQVIAKANEGKGLIHLVGSDKAGRKIDMRLSCENASQLLSKLNEARKNLG